MVHLPAEAFSRAQDLRRSGFPSPAWHWPASQRRDNVATAVKAPARRRTQRQCARALRRLARSLPAAVDLGPRRQGHPLRQLRYQSTALERLREGRDRLARGAGRRLPADQRGRARLQPARLPERRLLQRPHVRPDALRYPLKRVGERGEGKWRRISWDEALTEIADTSSMRSRRGRPRSFYLGPRHPRRPTAVTASGIKRLAICSTRRSSTSTPRSATTRRGAAVTLGKLVVRQLDGRLLLLRPDPDLGRQSALHADPERALHLRGALRRRDVVCIAPDYSPLPFTPTCGCRSTSARMPHWRSRWRRSWSRRTLQARLHGRADRLAVSRSRRHRRFLRAERSGGRPARRRFYVFDTGDEEVVEAPRRSLALGDDQPALEGVSRSRRETAR